MHIADNHALSYDIFFLANVYSMKPFVGPVTNPVDELGERASLGHALHAKPSHALTLFVWRRGIGGPALTFGYGLLRFSSPRCCCQCRLQEAYKMQPWSAVLPHHLPNSLNLNEHVC